jgi:hypothetical protein
MDDRKYNAEEDPLISNSENNVENIERNRTEVRIAEETQSLKSLDEEEGQDICRVCRMGSEMGRLFYPCKCSGSIKYIHEGKYWNFI